MELRIPAGAKVLHADCVGDSLFAWFLVNPEAMNETRKFRVFGTGFEIPEDLNLKYIATAKMSDGVLIWHIFEEFA